MVWCSLFHGIYIRQYGEDLGLSIYGDTFKHYELIIIVGDIKCRVQRGSVI